jgi:hypothetical protein
MANASLASHAPNVRITKQKNRSSVWGLVCIRVNIRARDRIVASSERRAINMCWRCVINARIEAKTMMEAMDNRLEVIAYEVSLSLVYKTNALCLSYVGSGNNTN